MLPIRKVSPSKVSLTSYYGKISVSRSEKKVDDYGSWLRNNIMAKGLDEADTDIEHLKPMNVFDPSFKAPRLYSIIAQGFRGFSAHGYEFNFDHTSREALFGEEAMKAEAEMKAIAIAVNADGSTLFMDNATGGIWRLEWGTIRSSKEKTPIRRTVLSTNEMSGKLETIEELLGIPIEKAPVDMAYVKLMGRQIPVGFVLAYELGLTNLCRLLKVQPRVVPVGTRLGLQADEWPIVFENESWVFKREDRLASLILSGFNEFHRALRDYGAFQFDRKDVYFNLLEGAGSATRYIREIDLAYQTFVDPITRELLEEMKEPTEFRGLLLRSCEMLLSDEHPDELDPAFMRTKGYERLAGTVYTELISAIRAHNNRPGKSKYPIEMSPFQVWAAIQTDPAKGQVSDINPIQDLKQQEAVTFSGRGGRSSRTMVKHTRAYHKNSMGVDSEATLDSGDVGVNVYTSADPQFTSLRGIARPYVVGKTGATALLSTSALLAPGSDRDDLRRVN